jgi:hypothetical protein
MITRLGSIPSSAKTRCWSRPVCCPASVWVLIGTPVCRCAQATARSTRSMPLVTPGLSVQHLRMPAFTPVSAMPRVMSSTNISTITSWISSASGARRAGRLWMKSGSSRNVYTPVATTMLMSTSALTAWRLGIERRRG